MNGTAARFIRLGVSLSGLVVLGWVLTGHAARPARHGIPLTTDWSNRHLIFSQPDSPELLARVSQDPRFEQQLHRRAQSLRLPLTIADLQRNVFADSGRAKSKKNKGLWSVDMGSGASVGALNYPSKFTFDDTTADCTNDYVMFSTGLQGGIGQANIVGFNNLYTGCGGTVPNVNWAYNTSGQVLTSPLISRDGSQIAFAQTNSGVGTLVIVRWKASATASITSPAIPTLIPNATYSSGCTAATAPCMTTVILHDGLGAVTDDTTSSIFYDYSNDIVWVGGARGWLHKVTGVFNGVPTEVHDGTFPVQMNPTNPNPLSDPVYDRVSGNVFVGDGGGFLYSVPASGGAVTQTRQLDFGTSPLQSPIVNVTYGLVYVFSSSDGTANCAGVACAAVFQLPTNFTAATVPTEVTVGTSVAVHTLPNPSPLYIGGFDSSYYTSLNATGNLYVCGNTGANAVLYQIPIAAGVMPANSTALTAVAKAGSTAPCSPVTDVSNPSTSAGFEERLFVSVQNNGRSAACASLGCIMNFIAAPWTASTSYALGQEILDSNHNIETVTTPGISGMTVPTWPNSPGTTKNDGTVIWTVQTNLSAGTRPSWVAGHNYNIATDRILDTNGNIEISTTPGVAGTTQPTWNMTVGGTTPDGTGTLVWTNAGPVSTLALSVLGGTSGMIIDNTVIGTLAGTSQIYFSTLTNQPACGSTLGPGGCAMQVSQSGLN